jgi:hypothetical protein
MAPRHEAAQLGSDLRDYNKHAQAPEQAAGMPPRGSRAWKAPGLYPS